MRFTRNRNSIKPYYAIKNIYPNQKRILHKINLRFSTCPYAISNRKNMSSVYKRATRL